MRSKPAAAPIIDTNGNIVCIENPDGYDIRIKGKNNRVYIKNLPQSQPGRIIIEGDYNSIEIGKSILKAPYIQVGSSSKVYGASIEIDDHFSVEPGSRFELFTSFGQILIGQNCLFSRNVTFHFGENPHLIFNKETGEYIDGNGRISIGEKVWIGEGAYLSKRAVVSSESIVAARAVVTRAFDRQNCVIAGNPAQVVKENIFWARNRDVMTATGQYRDSINHYDANVKKTLNTGNPDIKTSAGVWGDRWPDGTTCMFGIGAMKAGTSWLHDYLKTHRDVHFSPSKEVHYFNVLDFKSEQHHLNNLIDSLGNIVTRLRSQSIEQQSQTLNLAAFQIEKLKIYQNTSGSHEEYRNFLLRGWKAQKIVGDITPSYSILSEDRLKELYSLTSNVKFIYIMRDPVERLWSAVRMAAKQGSDDFEHSCLKISKDIIQNKNHPMLSRSDYEFTVRNLDNAADPKDVLFLFYEKMFSEDSAKRICKFLGIEYLMPEKSKLVNQGRSHEIPKEIHDAFLTNLKGQYNFAEQRFGADVPESWAHLERGY